MRTSQRSRSALSCSVFDFFEIVAQLAVAKVRKYQGNTRMHPAIGGRLGPVIAPIPAVIGDLAKTPAIIN